MLETGQDFGDLCWPFPSGSFLNCLVAPFDFNATIGYFWKGLGCSQTHLWHSNSKIT